MGNICCSTQRISKPTDLRATFSSESCSDTQTLDSFSVGSSQRVLPRQELLIRFYEQQHAFSDSSSLRIPVHRSKSLSFSSYNDFDSVKILMKEEMLSSSSVMEKAENIAEILRMGDEITREELEKLLKKLFEIAVDYCPLLPLKDFAGDCLKEREIVNYQNILRSQKSLFIRKTLIQIMKNNRSVSREQILECTCTLEMLLSPEKLRENILNQFIISP